MGISYAAHLFGGPSGAGAASLGGLVFRPGSLQWLQLTHSEHPPHPDFGAALISYFQTNGASNCSRNLGSIKAVPKD